ncbi:MAG: protein-L-isoaspartate(D-aspartate) O-methyltransferase [Methanobacteriaceae archaeon]|jgi:protein-L-isoaspartate(D-aspartate) O-methyltransferase|nr:protein-L-isoaspartate(D-aspartate) O-methyltransferase [Methanobacteriaceae archaeon]MDO9626887.1 protein-L-isoaspartate(D-aspartate) O-methyltransferase [Methanobacteriaceae archaeon]
MSKLHGDKNKFQKRLLERQKLVKNLLSFGFIKSDSVKRAMEYVPREEFLPIEQKPYAYIDRPLPIGEGQTISAPHMVAIICEILSLKGEMKVLEVGTGFGYNAAVVAEILGENGQLYSIERVESLFKIAKENLKRTGHGNVKLVLGDGSLGIPEAAPFERIYLTAAAPYIPETLKKQLNVGGKILAPIGQMDQYQELILMEKISKNKFKTSNLGGVAFVPLIGEHGW